MKRKLTIALVCLCLIAAACVTACSCGGDENEAKVRLEGGSVIISIDAVDGAKRYDIYHSESRFGKYELASSQTELTYSNKDQYGYYRVDAIGEDDKVIDSALYAYEIEVFGDNMHIYSPKDDPEQVKADIELFRTGDEEKGIRGTSQFGSGRFAGMFKAGDYSSLDLQLGYYMTYSGLGVSPEDTTIGGFNVYAELDGGNATCNFWRGIENFTVKSDVQWAVSQATSLRRMKIEGDMVLVQQGGSRPWGSGGFISDTVVTGTLNAGSQQQWLTRNTRYKTWNSSDINMVFVGCEGKFTDNSYAWPTRRITTIDKTPVVREKPYLGFNNGYYVSVPDLKRDSSGVSWEDGTELTTEYPLSYFHVARADRDNAATLNAALKEGKHLFFTPGIYDIEAPLEVNNPGTVIMGVGMATLRLAGSNTDTVMRIADVDGVNVSGLILDAGTRSKTLLEVGKEKTGVSHKDDPIVLSDMYFRIGGASDKDTFVDTTLVINADDVLGDNFWVWRADHGSGVGWERNVTKNGVIVNGDRMTVYGLMVEHFHEYQTVWNGEDGYMVFYQSETPYDVPDTETWRSTWHNNTYEGWASYKVSDGVQRHTALGLGVYYVSTRQIPFVLDHGIEVPDNSGVNMQHLAIANFSTGVKGGGIRHIVNEFGSSVIAPVSSQKTQFTSYVGGTPTP